MYGTIGLVALVIGAAVASLRIKKYGFKDTDVILASVFGGIGLLIGGTALYVIVQVPRLIQHWEHFSGDFALIVQFLFVGMVFYGGLFGAIFGLWAYARVFKRNFGNLLQVAVPVLPLTHSIMRLGCFAAGCCHGIEHATLGIAFTRSVSAPNGVPFLPVPLYESALNLIIFAAIWQFSKKERKPVHLLSFYAIPYAVGRFGLEFLRGDAARGAIFALSTSQFISILVVVACLIALTLSKRPKTA